MRLRSLLAKIRPTGGVDRWPVKCGTDAAAITVPATPIPTTIAQLISLPAPKRPTARLPQESVIYSVPCVITLAKYEADSDVHLVLRDEAGNTMIGEIPLPTCVNGPSPWLDQITAARAQFDEWPRLGKPCVVTGVCLFDFAHGQTGVAPNAVELHPVLSIVDPLGV
jgi:hypothetical protein